MKKLLLIHPFLFSFIAPIILYISLLNVTVFIPPSDVILPILLSSFIGLVLYFIGLSLTRDQKSAAVFASIFVVGLLYLFVIFLAVLLITILIILIAKIVRKKIGFNEVNFILMAVSLSLCLYYLYQFIGFSVSQNSDLLNSLEPVTDNLEISVKKDEYPDIYYIILDGYGRADMLEKIHGYDNTAFIAGLEERGFKVADMSQSNYARTLLSISSSLNMQYLDGLSQAMSTSISWWPANDIIQHSEIRTFLEREGYTTIFISSGWDLTDIRDGDYYLKPFPIMLKNFQAAFINWTNLKFLSTIDQSLIHLNSNDNSRRRILYNFETLPEVSSLKSPKFVFAHILAPHGPFLFNSNGEPVDEDFYYPKFGVQVASENVSLYKQAYLDELTYINKLTLEMVDGIKTNSTTPPVIIIQGDHGPDVFMNFEDPNLSCLYERFSILNALEFPGIDPSLIPEDINPVNSFRFLLNLYFGANLPLLPNHQYFSPNSNIYQFQDVSVQSENMCNIPSATK